MTARIASVALTIVTSLLLVPILLGIFFTLGTQISLPGQKQNGSMWVQRGEGPVSLADGRPDIAPNPDTRSRLYVHVRHLKLSDRALNVLISAAVPTLAPISSQSPPTLSLLLFEPTDTGAAGSSRTCGSRIPSAVQRISLSSQASSVTTSPNASAVTDLPIRGNPDGYPTDRYSLSFCAAVEVGAPQGASLINLLTVLVEADQELLDHELWVNPEVEGRGAGTDASATTPTHLVALSISRNGIQQGFAYAMIALPFLMGVGLVVLTFFVKDAVPKNASQALVGLSAIVLTILPLRAVLVPSEVASVAGVTLADYILGAELVGLVVIAMLRGTLDVWGRSPEVGAARSGFVNAHASAESQKVQLDRSYP